MTGLEPFAVLHEEPGEVAALPSGLRRLYGGDLGLPERCLYANFVATVDGVVAIPSLPGSNRLISGGSEADRFVMGALRAAADLVLIGSGTLRASPRGRWRPETVYPPGEEHFAAFRRELGYDAEPARRDSHRLGVDPERPPGARRRRARPHHGARRRAALRPSSG